MRMSPPLGGTSSEPVNRSQAFLSDLAISTPDTAPRPTKANRGIPALWIASGLFATFAILALMMRRAGLTVCLL
ncbi:hypothetical protein CX046_25765, partial [Salmonella enterica subsp. enterica serovar Typhimurium]